VLLARRPDIDAIFAASDVMAAGALQALERAGRRAGIDVAVVGFDDSDTPRLANPPLTTVRQPIEDMGRQMAAILLEHIAEGTRAPRRVVLDTELVVRSSS
jgi:DNA-binding LacI/PurR family transcriptional regulator